MQYFQGLVKQMIKQTSLLRRLEKFFLKFMKILFHAELGIQTLLLSLITFLHSKRNQRQKCVAFENSIPLFYLKIHSISEVKGSVIISCKGRVILRFKSLQYKINQLHSFFLSL
jgi:hypothetical protein